MLRNRPPWRHQLPASRRSVRPGSGLAVHWLPHLHDRQAAISPRVRRNLVATGRKTLPSQYFQGDRDAPGEETQH